MLSLLLGSAIYVHYKSTAPNHPFDHCRFADIADVAFKKSSLGRPRMMNSLSISVADTVFSIGVEVIFLVQGKICTYIIPLTFVGQVSSDSILGIISLMSDTSVT